MQTIEPIQELPNGGVIEKFQPVAYYDKHMDCLRIFIRDCSVTEKRVDRFLTLHKTNHAGQFGPKYVGFTIKGIRHLFDELGLPLHGIYSLTEIVDRIVKLHPGSTMSSILEFVYAGFEEHTTDLQVDLERDLAA